MGRRIEPTHAHHGLRGIGELRLHAERRRGAAGGAAELVVFGVGYLTAAEVKRRNRYAMHGTLFVTPIGLAHEKFAAGNEDQIEHHARDLGAFLSFGGFLARGSGSTIENCSLRSAASTRSSDTRTRSPIENSRRVRWPTILRTLSW